MADHLPSHHPTHPQETGKLTYTNEPLIATGAESVYTTTPPSPSQYSASPPQSFENQNCAIVFDPSSRVPISPLASTAISHARACGPLDVQHQAREYIGMRERREVLHTARGHEPREVICEELRARALDSCVGVCRRIGKRDRYDEQCRFGGCAVAAITHVPCGERGGRWGNRREKGVSCLARHSGGDSEGP